VTQFDFDADRRAFRIEIDGRDRWMPMLESDDFAGWNARHARVYVDLQHNLEQGGGFPGAIRAEQLAEDAIIDAIQAYDRTGVLGPRAEIEETWTVEQLIVIARRIGRAHG
jgi:hypothetical protein